MRLALGAMVVMTGCVALNPDYAEASGAGEGTAGGGTEPTTGSPSSATVSPVTSGDPTLTTSDAESDTLPNDSSSGEPGDTNGIDGWWDSSYAHRIRVDFFGRGESLEDFVALVDLDYGDAQPFLGLGTSQIVVVAPGTGARLPVEVVLIEPDGSRLVMWVRLASWPGLGVTPVDVYFGASAPQTPSSSPWGPPFVGVWHFDTVDEGATPNVAAGPPGVLPQRRGVAEPASTEGVVFRGVRLTGENGGFVAEYEPTQLPTYFTALGWVRLDLDAEGTQPLLARGREVHTPGLGADWTIGVSADEVAGTVRDTSGSNPLYELGGDVLPPDGAWHFAALSADVSTLLLYVDGARAAEGAYGGPPGASQDVVSLGMLNGPNNAVAPDLRGSMDEVMLLSGAVSETWVGTAFDNQSLPWTTYEQGPVETF